MLNISSLLFQNAVQYWENICKDKCELATRCVANCDIKRAILKKLRCVTTFCKRYTWVQNGYTSFETI